MQHDSETDENQDLHLDDEESDFETLSEIGAEAIAETFELERDEVNDKQVGDWLLVKFNSERKISQYFIGTIESIDLETENPIVIFFATNQRHPNPAFTWPDVEDISEITTTDVIRVLPSPSVGRRGEINFPVSFSDYPNIN